MAEGVVVLNVEADKVCFVIKNAEGAPMATSIPFPTICRLEAALQALASAEVHDWRLVTGPAGSLVKVGRRQVPLREQLVPEAISQLIQVVTTARILHERPASRRRYDLSGLRCDLAS